MITLARRLGQGTFGYVYLARRKRVGDRRWQAVAVKFPMDGNSEELRGEFDMLRACAHPGVVVAMDFLEGEGLQQLPESSRKYGAAIVMEAAVSDLASFLEAQGPCLDAGLAKDWSRSLASALAMLHSKGIIHRDVKPQNMLLCLDASSSRPDSHVKCTLKLTDFGSARRLPHGPKRRLEDKQPCAQFYASESGQDIQDLHRQHPMTPGVCTAWYRAPELLSESATAKLLDKPLHESLPPVAYGAAMDVWSYGAVVFELLTGGEKLARAMHGAGLLRMLLERLEACPYPCLDAGGQAGVPSYMTTPGWKSLYEAACATPLDRTPLPKGDAWGVVGGCLRWTPRHRLSMAQVLRQPWLAEITSELPAASASTSGAMTSAGTVTNPSTTVSPACASTPGGMSLPPPKVWSPEGRAQEYTTTPVLQPCRDYTQRDVEKAGGQCQCKGHCRIFAHRKDGKCLCKAVVEGTVYCRSCLCKVQGCTRAKNKSDMCYMHRRIFEGLPLHMQLAVLGADCAPWLVPCDVVDYLHGYEETQNDLAICIICALVKEPTVTSLIREGWRQLPADYDAEQLRRLLESVALVCDSSPDAGQDGDAASQHDKELEQLGRQGVARVSGFATCLKNLGLIRKLAEGEQVPPGMAIVLGRTHIPYVFTLDSTRITKFLAEVRDAAPGLVRPCFDAGTQSPAVAFLAVSRYGQQVRGLMAKLADTCQFVAKKVDGYTADIIIRKLCLPHWSRATQWSEVPSSSLRAVSADESESLEKLPSEWSAADVSSFICQRPDWGYLASAYVCLWKEVADQLPDARALVGRLTTLSPSALMSGSSPLLEAAKDRLHQHGIAMHPYVLLKDLRASTPEVSLGKAPVWAARPGASQGKKRAHASTPPQTPPHASTLKAARASTPGKTKNIKRARVVANNSRWPGAACRKG